MSEEPEQTERPKTLRETIDELRAIPAKWKELDDPVEELRRIRADPHYNPWAKPKWKRMQVIGDE